MNTLSNQLIQSNEGAENRFFKVIWGFPVPSKVVAFAWRVAHQGIPTMKNLMKRAIKFENNRNGNCDFCQEHVEDTYHVLFVCKLSYDVWMSCYHWLRIQIAFPANGVTHFLHHGAWGEGAKTKSEVKIYLGCLCMEYLAT